MWDALPFFVNIIEKLNNVNRDDLLNILNNYANTSNSMSVPEPKQEIVESNDKDDKITEFLSKYSNASSCVLTKLPSSIDGRSQF